MKAIQARSKLGRFFSQHLSINIFNQLSKHNSTKNLLTSSEPQEYICNSEIFVNP